MGKLDGKVAAITAGTRSIGRGVAEAFLAEGARVVVNGRSPDKGAAALAEIDAGDSLAFYTGDASSQPVIEGLVEFGIDHFRQIDIIVLNAGGVREPAPIIAMTDEEWQYELDLNLNHTFWGMRAAFRHMVPRGWGRVIAMSSIEGKEGKANVAGYTANRHAINGLVKAAAREVGQHGITVNAICPGLVVTDMLIERAGRSMGVGSVDEVVALYTADTALRRPVTVQEIAAFAVHLASDAGAGFTGGTISLDAGSSFY